MYISVGMFILFVCQKLQSAESRVIRIPDVFLLVPRVSYFGRWLCEHFYFNICWPQKITAGERRALLQYDACERAAAINIHAWFTETHLHLHSSWVCSQTSSVLQSFFCYLCWLWICEYLSMKFKIIMNWLFFTCLNQFDNSWNSCCVGIII